MATNNAINLNDQGIAYYDGAGTFSAPSLTQFGIVVGDAANNIASLSVGATGTVLIGNTGANPSFSATPSLSGLTLTVTPLGVPSGGTGHASFTANGVLLGNTAGALNVTSAGTVQGQVLLGGAAGGGTAPNFGALTITGNTGGALPFAVTAGAGNWSIVGAAGISTSGSGSTLTISATGGFTWVVNVQADSPVAVVSNTGYIANGIGTVVYALPATAAVGTTVRFTGENNATGWQVTANAGQTIHFGSVDSTVAGSLTSTAIRDSVELVCVAADTDWNVLSSVGNITVA
ncbi:MAG: hypothetical protein V4487_09290 [Chlamydiota bacterium]